MFRHLIKFSIDFRPLVVAAALFLLVCGTYVSTQMPVDVFPDLTAPTVVILTDAHGMAPEEVEKLITFPLETAMNGAAGVRRVRSSSTVGMSIVWVEFQWGHEIKTARQTVNEKLTLVRNSIPPEIDTPVLAPQSSIMGEMMIVALSSDTLNLFDIRTLADTTLRRRLLAVRGVAQVTPIGGEVKQYQVVLSPSRLLAYAISAEQVAEVLAKSNENTSAGILVEGGQEFLIQGLGRVRQIEDIEQTVVAVRNETPVRVGDLGVVQIGPELRRGVASAMGKPAVVVAITKQPNVNTLELTERLNATLDDFAANLPEGVTLHRNIFQQADFITTAVGNVQRALRDGAILVVVVVLLFLGNARASIITLTAIPLSLVTTVMVLSAWGASINTMTLGGMAIAIGELVDDAIVDVENVFRRLRENFHRPVAERLPAARIILDASIEIRSSIVFATVIVVLVFLPLFFLPGIEGRMLMPLGVAYIVAMLSSLIVAVTVTPALCSFLLPQSKSIASERETLIVRWLKRSYRPVLDGVLKHPHAISAAAVSLLLIAVATMPFVGQSFLPEFDEGALTITANTMPGTSLEQSDELGLAIESILQTHPEVKSFARQTGRGELAEHTQGVETSEITVSLDMHQPAEKGLPVRSREEFLEALREDLATLPGLVIEVGQPISHRIDHMLSGTRAAVAVKIFAPEEDTASLLRLRELAEMVQHEIEDIPGVVDLAVEQQMHVPALTVAFDRQRIAQQGLQVADVAHELQRAFAGQRVSDILEGRNRFGLVVRVSQPDAICEEDIYRLPVATPAGAQVPLGALARIRRDRSPNQISRENVQRKIVVSFNIAGRDIGSVVSDVQEQIRDRVPIGKGQYSGYYVDYGGQFENARSAFRMLTLLGIGVVMCIGLLLHVAFGSARDAMLVLLNLPMALIGGVFGVWVSGGVLSVASLVGFITLLGIATRNGIMLVSHIRHIQAEEGETNFRAAIHRGAMERLAPILMTALSTGLGLLPLAMAGGHAGSEIETPLAIVVLFGLLTSTALNMLVIPALFLRWASSQPAASDSRV